MWKTRPTCLHRIIFRTAKHILQPLARALHRQKLNEVVYLDFDYIGSADKSDF